jgi:hypothetical protein
VERRRRWYVSTGIILLIPGLLLFWTNVYWNNELNKKKIELEERERKINLNEQGADNV